MRADDGGGCRKGRSPFCASGLEGSFVTACLTCQKRSTRWAPLADNLRKSARAESTSRSDILRAIARQFRMAFTVGHSSSAALQAIRIASRCLL